MLTLIELDPVNEPWVAECEVCGQHYPNHCGSTPCCGSIAFIVPPHSIYTPPARPAHPGQTPGAANGAQQA